METTQKSDSFSLGWLPHLVVLAVAVAVLAAGLGANFVLRNQPPPRIAPTSFHIWNVSDALAALRAAGLEAEIIRGGPRDERDGFANMVEVESLRFLIPSAAQPAGGMILSFHNAVDQQKMLDYYVGLNKSLPQFSSQVFVKDNILLQLDGDLPEQTAQKYKAALNALDVR